MNTITNVSKSSIDEVKGGGEEEGGKEEEVREATYVCVYLLRFKATRRTCL